MSTDAVIYSAGGKSAYIPSLETSVSISAAVDFPQPSDDKPVKQPVQKMQGSEVYSPWGEDNLFPQNLIELIEKNDLIPTVIDRKARILYGQGLVYGVKKIEGASEVFTPLVVAEIEAWLRNTAAHRYLKEAAEDYYTFENIYPSLRFNGAGQAVSITCEDAVFCRLSKQNSAGRIEKCYVNANWDNGGTEKDSLVYPVIDPYFDMPGQVALLKSDRAIIPLRSQTKGRVYYDMPDWYGIVVSGWLDVANSIPEFKKALMRNSITIKWHLSIPDYWWRWKWKDWDGFVETKQLALQKETLDSFIEIMKGAQGAGNVLMTTYKYDMALQREFPGWKITPMKTESSSGDYIEDSQEADFHIIRAMGVDPSIIGIGPGKGHSAGSGSDKRVALNAHILSTKPEADVILEPFVLASALNGWDETYGGEAGCLTWMMKSYFMATLDQVSNEKRM